MNNVAELFLLAGFLVTVVNRLVEGLIKPIYDRAGWDKFSLMYVSWLLGGTLVALSGIDLFSFVDWMYPVVGYILTGLVAGGGANLLNDIYNLIPSED